MKIVIQWDGGWRVADRAFYFLVGLITVMLVGLLGALVGRLPGAVDILQDSCRHGWDALVSTWLIGPQVGLGTVPLMVIGGVLGVLFIALLIQWLVTQRLLRSLLRGQQPLPEWLAELTLELNLSLDHVILVKDRRNFSFCYGLRNPRILISTGMVDLLDHCELRALLTHERHHLENSDPVKVWASRAITYALWFIPIVRTLRDHFLVAKEIAADESTAWDTEGQISLASALVKVLASGSRPQFERVAAIGAFNVAEERVERLILKRATTLPELSRRNLFFSGLVILALFLISYGPYTSHAAQAAPLESKCKSVALM
ncbi:MAG: M56 family peptidase [Chloroflexi bacterium]|nr:M56 family peptidase [Chloroflexota bacterium]